MKKMFLLIVLLVMLIGCGNNTISNVVATETETTEEDRLMNGLYESGHYVRNCKIIAVKNVDGNTVYIVKGKQNYMYAFYGLGYETGNVVKCVFWEGNDKTTCIDDELVDVW